MLNEWIEIRPTLEKLGCDLGESHPSFNRCPKSKKGFLICLGATGNVEDVRTPDFPMDTVYRWNEGNHEPAFPVFNCRALYEVVCDESLIPPDLLDTLKETGGNKSYAPTVNSSNSQRMEEQTLRSFVKSKCRTLWSEQDLHLVRRCLKDLPLKLEGILDKGTETPPGYKAFKELVRRANLCDEMRLCSEVESILLQKLAFTGKREYAEGLFALKKEGKRRARGKEHGRDYLYLLTIRDWDSPEYGERRHPPYHSSLQNWMARVFEQHAATLHRGSGTVDAFGLDAAGMNEKHLDIKNAGGVSKMKLFAANEAILCLTRYGLQSTRLFPAGHAARETARKALEYVLNSARKETTWKSLKKYENRDCIAFAYCTELKDANAIRVFDADDDDNDENLYISEESTKAALQTFEGILKSERNSASIVIGIMEVLDDGGNTKILASRHYPLDHYLAGARRWQHGCANVPQIVLPRSTGTERSIAGSIPVFPIRAVWLLNSSWRQDGEMIARKQGNRRVPISKRFSPSDALDLLFERNDVIRERVDAGLMMAVEKSSQVLIKARLKADLDYYRIGNKLDFRDSKYLHMLPTLYGLLLHKKGIRKEEYMKEALFSLGRLFAAADRLHIYYSQKERHGDIPARLLGNDHMPLALQNPQEAFVTLGHRMLHPYVSWARRFQEEGLANDGNEGQDDERDESKFRKNVAWCLWNITNLSELLSNQNLPVETDDAGKAKLILGYLSYGAKQKTTGDNANVEDKDEKEADDNE